jgi:hypothetical protein
VLPDVWHDWVDHERRGRCTPERQGLMTFSIILALMLGASTSIIAGTEAPLKWANLSSEEKRHVERLAPQADLCSTQECRAEAFESIRQIIRLRRTVYGKSMSDVTLSRLRWSCDKPEFDLQAIVECLRARQNVSFEDGMRLAGHSRAGITAEGYAQIRIGMEIDEVEYILDDFGEELSYASSGGYSAATYQWIAGRRIIIVSFSDDKVSGRSQSGLYRE